MVCLIWFTDFMNQYLDITGKENRVLSLISFGKVQNPPYIFLHKIVLKFLLGSLQFSRLPRTTKECTQSQRIFRIFLQLLEVSWETTANRLKTLTHTCAEKNEGVLALYSITFDLVLQKL